MNEDNSILAAKIVSSTLCFISMANLRRHHINDLQVTEKWSPHNSLFLFWGSEWRDAIRLLLNAELDLFCETDGHHKKSSTICLNTFNIKLIKLTWQHRRYMIAFLFDFSLLENFKVALFSFHFHGCGPQTKKHGHPWFTGYSSKELKICYLQVREGRGGW